MQEILAGAARRLAVGARRTAERGARRGLRRLAPRREADEAMAGAEHVIRCCITEKMDRLRPIWRA